MGDLPMGFFSDFMMTLMVIFMGDLMVI